MQLTVFSPSAGYCGVSPFHWPGISMRSGNVDTGRDGVK